MKGRNQRISGTAATQKVPNAELHLIGGFVRERDGEDVLRTHITILDQMSHAIRNDPCLTASGAGKDEHRPFDGFNSFQLFRIQKLRKIHLHVLISVGPTGREVVGTCVIDFPAGPPTP